MAGLAYRPGVPSLPPPAAAGPDRAHRRRRCHRARGWLARAGTSAVVLVVALVGLAGPASAHGSRLRTDDRATVSSIDPPTPGLEVRVRATGLVRVRAPGHREVVVLGYEPAKEPYLRIEGSTVSENRLSPATYLNRSLTGAVEVPAEASSSATPVWVAIGHDGEASWHDHRLHRMGPAPGALRWRLDLLVDGRPVAVTGELVPLARPPAWPWYALGVVVAAGAALAWRRLVARRRALLLGGLAVAFVASLAVAASMGGTLAWAAAGAALVAGAVTTRADEAWAAGMAGLVAAVAGWFQLADLGYAALFVRVPAPAYRIAVVLCVTAGLVLAAWSFDVTRRGGFRRLRRATG
jgi:hypothetical protein